MADDRGDDPERLYHYTNADGLMGIIDKSELWATDCRFLNDTTEFEVGLDIVTKGLSEMGNPADDPRHPMHGVADSVAEDYWTFTLGIIEELSTNCHTFVACFCEDGDLLSQWRGYALRHGYSIGFNLEILATSVEAVVGSSLAFGELRRVVYDFAIAQEISDEIVRFVSESPIDLPGVKAFHFGLLLSLTVATIKDRGFQEEREWRAIVSHYQAPGVDAPPEALFRATERAIVPYVKLPFDKSAIERIIVGPSPDQNVRIRGLKRYLNSHGLDVPVLRSELPYRS